MTELPETQRERRGHSFYPPADLPTPPLYATDSVSWHDKTIVVHYFVGACDWWIVEYEPETGLAFGYACLGDSQLAEWGYVSLVELEEIATGPLSQPVERDLWWTPVLARDAKLHGSEGATCGH